MYKLIYSSELRSWSILETRTYTYHQNSYHSRAKAQEALDKIIDGKIQFQAWSPRYLKNPVN
jgi:hypothetical protein